MENLINIRGLSKEFKTRNVSTKVLNEIDMTVNRGDFIAIEGPSGCGKSTLLSIVGLLDEATSGQYRLCDTETVGLDGGQLRHLRNNNIGWIFQDFNLIGDMTVAQNIMLPLKYTKGLSTQQKQAMVKTALTQVNLLDKEQFLPSELSGGQQQRVAIARALINDPDLILADEPTGNLDSENSALIFDLLSELNQQSKTIIMVTHSPEMAKRCKTQLAMLDGRFTEQSHD
jgi:putative ABC transport system ATP-binding protein